MKWSQAEAAAFTDSLKYGSDGLIPVVVQDADSPLVLMVAYATREAVEKTLTTGVMHYWSRERKKLWLKGETSGHYQHVQDITVDCDNDTLLVKVKQVNGACHLGYKSCFFRRFSPSGLEEIKELKC